MTPFIIYTLFCESLWKWPSGFSRLLGNASNETAWESLLGSFGKMLGDSCVFMPFERRLRNWLDLMSCLRGKNGFKSSKYSPFSFELLILTPL